MADQWIGVFYMKTEVVKECYLVFSDPPFPTKHPQTHILHTSTRGFSPKLYHDLHPVRP